MFKLIRFVKNLKHFDSRLKENEKLQRENGYRIEFVQEGPERYITYHEDGREVTVRADFSILNDVVLYRNSFRKWDKPAGQELTSFDYHKLLNRLVSYFACWGDVTLDDSQLPEAEDISESLIRDGIPFEELDDGIIHYQSTIDEERRRKGGFFNR